VLGEYEVTGSASGGAGGGTAAPHCTGPEQCSSPADQCVEGVCREPCLDKPDCYYYFSVCSGGYCSEHVGVVCASAPDCGGLECITTDNRSQPVPGYCTMYCSHTWECPQSYECISSECAVIGSGGPLCYVAKAAPCSSCVVQNCAWELQDCCGFSAPCGSAQSAIDACDQTRTVNDCNGLYTESTIDALRSCITLHCESYCWNPCPGDACR
jgi:hypothetical protein